MIKKIKQEVVLSVKLCILCLVVFTSVDIQAALYELSWQVVQGNLKWDLGASVLGDLMVHMLLFCVFTFRVNDTKHMEELLKSKQLVKFRFLTCFSGSFFLFYVV